MLQRPGLNAGPHWGAYSAPQTPIPGFRGGKTGKGMEGRMETGDQGRKGEGKRGKDPSKK